jgi:hypothetical protein
MSTIAEALLAKRTEIASQGALLDQALTALSNKAAGSSEHALPSGYTAVPYIENTGTAYVNLKIPCKKKYLYAYKFTIGELYNDYNCWLGAKGTNHWYIAECTSAGTPYVGWASNAYTTYAQGNIIEGIFQQFSGPAQGGALFLPADGESIVSYSNSVYANLADEDNVFMHLFRRNDGNYPAKGKLHYLDLFEVTAGNGLSLVGRFHTCTRDSDDTAGIYSTFANEFLEPTGTLVAGTSGGN